MTVFRTGDPHAILRRAVEATEGRDAPSPAAPPIPSEQFESYCVFEGSVRMPVFQEGTPPYSNEGGQWRLDADGAPLLIREEEARIVFTIPRQTMPANGFPTVMFVRTGAGGDRPLVDRGAHNAMGETIANGTGPALEFARAGFAGVSVEGPHGGSRNISGGDEQFLVFNIQNPIALRDNLRQSALELVLLARALDEMTIDASSCPGFSAPSGDLAARFDTSHLAIMGHSMGASIAPLAAAFEPRLRALILSGAGGSWIENILHKERPFRTRELAEALLRYSGRGYRLGADDPVLGLLQWAGEPADAQIYGPLLVGSRHVLMFQGIVDHYILPPIANALSLSLSLDLAGPALDTSLLEYTPIADLLSLRSRSAITLPAAGNIMNPSGALVTAVVAQHPEDGIEDGHETVFQTEAPKTQYRCFLQTFARDQIPVVPSLTDPC
jgi:pimeloyl-ACP methyl ester carboxylesterase